MNVMRAISEGAVVAVLMAGAGIYGHQSGFEEADRFRASIPNARGFVKCIDGKLSIGNIDFEGNFTGPVINVTEGSCRASGEQ